ncbi:glycosyltransferase [Granulicella sibirica]|uniref:Glycosyl transferase, group 2 family protein/polysaccharide deacetylase family protein n=1 Tax=Granulicella sibirica TaxID=2479048 RepID=A0A4Q0T475_9BACT|nr:glycosyltransferase [Granulicella sibirica]RXH56838.1 Glycosyl transferase, group 2 family protein/polysaccharide deacetylase family protein [Granulicella sibirica]
MSEQREELTIVIPAKNEAEMLPKLLTSLCAQDYPALPATRIVIADAGSTDHTVDLALAFSDRLRIEIIRGSLPAVGRNAGARIATSTYVLFLDADVELGERTLVRRALEAMRTRRLECCTTNIECRLGGFFDDALYLGNNLMQRIGSMLKPFATGMFMMFDRDAFWRLGGFNEQALFAEDYLLSKEVARNRFTIVPGRVYTSNRRFRKVGHGRMVWMFAKTMLHSWDTQYFLRDQGYWEEAEQKVA